MGGLCERLGVGFWTLAGHEDPEVLPRDLRVGGPAGSAGHGRSPNGVRSELGRENSPYWKRPREDRQAGRERPGWARLPHVQPPVFLLIPFLPGQ